MQKYALYVSHGDMMTLLEEKDFLSALLSALYLLKKTPTSKSVYFCVSECLDKLNLSGSAKRASILGLHTNPLDIPLLDQTIKYTDLDVVKLRKLALNPQDFDLNLFFFKKNPKDMFDHVIKHLRQPLHFKIIFEECVKNGYDDLTLQTLKQGVKIYPNEFLYILSEYYSKVYQPFLAFKYLLMSSYFTHSNDYLLAADYLEKSGHDIHAILCLYQYYKESQNTRILDRILEKIVSHNKKRKKQLAEKAIKSMM